MAYRSDGFGRGYPRYGSLIYPQEYPTKKTFDDVAPAPAITAEVMPATAAPTITALSETSLLIIIIVICVILVAIQAVAISIMMSCISELTRALQRTEK